MANYLVRDGNGTAITIKSITIVDPDSGASIQVPQSIATDANGVPYSSSNPLPVATPAGANSSNNIGATTDVVDGSGNGSVIAQARNICSILLAKITVKITGSPTSWTDYSGSITTSGTAQDIVAVNANRKGFFIQNLDTTNNLFINFTGNATTSAGSILVPPYSTWEMSAHTLSTARISVIGVAGTVFTSKEAN